MTFRLIVGLIVAVAALAPAPARAQGTTTEDLARQLTALLDKAKLDSIAARLQGTQDEFVAALYFPGSQLLVVSAKYAAPPLLNEKVLLKRYRDAYLDLSAATDPATRVIVEDLAANGLHAKRANNEPFDFYTAGGTPRFAFDGQWKKRKLSEEEYMKTFATADAQYAKMLQSLIAEAKGGAQGGS